MLPRSLFFNKKAALAKCINSLQKPVKTILDTLGPQLKIEFENDPEINSAIDYLTSFYKQYHAEVSDDILRDILANMKTFKIKINPSSPYANFNAVIDLCIKAIEEINLLEIDLLPASSAATINPMMTSASPLPQEEPAPAVSDLQTLVNALPRITVGIMTFNCGNTNLPPEAVEQLQQAIAVLDADLMFFSFQESKRALHPLRYFENLADRILKRFRPEGAEENPYTVLAFAAAKTPTHMNPFTSEGFWNYFNLPRAKVAIAFKKDKFPNESPIEKGFKKYAPWNPRKFKFNIDQKGGLYNTVEFPDLAGFQINFIGVHLDSKDYANGQRQAEELIALATADDLIHSSVTFMAGDFNTRIHEKYVKSKHYARAAPLDDLLDTEDVQTVNARSIAEWQKSSPSIARLKGGLPCVAKLNVVPLCAMTYQKQDSVGRISYNSKRETHDVGAVDLIAFTKSTHSRATVQHEESLVIILEPIGSAGEPVSDHKAVITRYTVLPPITPKEKRDLYNSFKITSLVEIHRILEAANHPDLMRTYFEYAINEVSVDSDNINLLKEDITFIINNLNALSDQMYNSLYARYIFETCVRISALEQDDGKFILDKFNQLLEIKVDASMMKMPLLSPFRQWLDEHQKPRERYTFNEHGAFRRLGFFDGQRIPSELNSTLTSVERQKIR